MAENVLTVLPAGARTGVIGAKPAPGATTTNANGPDFGTAIEAVEHHLSTAPSDDITIEAGVGGALAGPAKRDGAELRWSKGDRAVRMGEMVVVDAKGTELYRALPAANKDHVSLAVPREALSGISSRVGRRTRLRGEWFSWAKEVR